jgi:hypothetical protein
MTPEKLGSLIGAVFGLVFVLVNAATLPPGIGTLVRVLGVVAFLLVLVALRRPRRSVAVARPARGGLGMGYWLVVAAEVLAFPVGVRVLSGPLDAPDGGVAWVALIVGLHFNVLAVVWAERLFHWLGASMALCGLVGLALALTGSPKAATGTVGGVLPGALLLAFALWGVRISTDPAGSRGLDVGNSVGGAE